MVGNKARRIALLGFVFAGGRSLISAQAIPTAIQRITPSVFAGVSGVYTGLNAGRNLSVIAGVDLSFRAFGRVRPELEYRGMYAIRKSGSDSLQNSLGGIKLSTSLGHLRPYLDLLAGRGETTYVNGGYQVPGKPIFYTKSSSNVFSLGGGVDLLATRRLAVKVDVQGQRYSSPVTPSGHLYSQTGTIGVAYIFHAGPKFR